ncbi:MAG: sucrose-6-phosphate hydrolase [Propioniciclava sp.]|uniref:glycoside hydrolase family 32 protein n=1 Tax=Propioniciclava sp. TaxID=2038686 RepID=UPI0039E60922
MHSDDDLMGEAAEAIARSKARLDPDYPRFHLAPPVGRLNDPNGLLIRDGEYHAFYQFGPFFPERKETFWGHASSRDLATWQHHRPAIAPSDWYDRSGAYSGTAFFEGSRIWLHYSGNVKNDDGSRATYQCAVTTDDLEMFSKHPANPLIPDLPQGYTAHLRDPQIHVEGDGYLMLVGGQRSDETGCLVTYRSRDLVEWTFTGEITFPGAEDRFGAFGYMWECPNLLRLTDEVTGQERDVLIFCPQGIGPIGDGFRNIFACGYLVGRLDGTAFHADGDFLELDRGFEFYAPQVFRPQPAASGQQPLLLGWIGNSSEDHQPSLRDHGWVHLMGVPRLLALRDGVLHQRPALTAVPQTVLAVQGTVVGPQPVRIDELTGQDAFWLALEIDRSTAAPYSLTLATADDSRVVITLTADTLTVDRSATRYPHGERRTLALPPALQADAAGAALLRVDLLHDRSVTELFLGDGLLAFSMRSYLDPGVRTVTLAAQAKTPVPGARVSLLGGGHADHGELSE